MNSSAKLKSSNKLQNTKSIISEYENKLWQSSINKMEDLQGLLVYHIIDKKLKNKK